MKLVRVKFFEKGHPLLDSVARPLSKSRFANQKIYLLSGKLLASTLLGLDLLLLLLIHLIKMKLDDRDRDAYQPRNGGF